MFVYLQGRCFISELSDWNAISDKDSWVADYQRRGLWVYV